MWLMTIYGFYSVAAADKRVNGRDNELMVRARMRDHLVKLQERFPVLNKLPIVALDHADYKYRIVVNKAVWGWIVGEMAVEQSWSNFKSEVYKSDDHYNSGYEEALHEVWSILLRLQLREHLPNTRRQPSGSLGYGLGNYRSYPAKKSKKQRKADARRVLGLDTLDWAALDLDTLDEGGEL